VPSLNPPQGITFTAPNPAPSTCLTQPIRDAPWASGNGSGGGNFESWLVIA
jgi:hypothetical protein